MNIFLDIDGVLNSYITKNAFDSQCVANFNILLEKTNADVILSSSWRHLIYNGMFSIKGFEFLLKSHGVSNLKLAGMTEDDTSECSKRIDQINNYVKEHNLKNYVALDDYFLDKDNSVRVNGSSGLQIKDVDLAIKILNKSCGCDGSI